MKPKAKTGGVVLLVFALMGAAGYWWGANDAARWHSPPGKPRGIYRENWETSFGEDQTSSRTGLARVEGTLTRDGLTFTLSQKIEGFAGVTRDHLIEADDQGVARLPGGGRLILRGIGTSILTRPKAEAWDEEGQLPLDWFHPYTKEAITPPADHPSWGFATHEGPLSLSPMATRIWLEREPAGAFTPCFTHVWFTESQTPVLAGGGGWRRLWAEPHQQTSPVMRASELRGCLLTGEQIAINIQGAGPATEVVDIPLETGATFSLDKTKGRIGFIQEGVSKIDFVERPELPAKPSFKVQFRFENQSENGKKPQRSILLLFDRLGAYSRHATWLDETGREFAFGPRPLIFNGLTVLQAPPEARRLRLYSHPDWYQVVFRLPSWPGVPDSNDAVKDLFDIHIPYVRLEHEAEFEYLISQTTRLNFWELSGAAGASADAEFPPGYFPKSFTDTTPRELLSEYRNHIDARISINGEKLRIEMSDPGGQAWTDLLNWLGLP